MPMHLARFLWHSLHRTAQAEIFTILCIGAVAVAYVALAADAPASVSTNCVHNNPSVELPKPLLANRKLHDEPEPEADLSMNGTESRQQRARTKRPTLMDTALQVSAREGLDAMAEFYGKIVPDIIRNGQLLEENHPATLLSQFSAPVGGSVEQEMAAYATISATKAFRRNFKHFNELARQAHTPRISLRRTALEGLCPPRDPPACTPASERYRTHDGTCNNKRRPRWGAAQMPFNRFLPPEYGDGVDSIRESVEGGPLSSSRFVSLLVHGAKDGEAPLTLMTAQWGQLLDHDMTSTAQPRSINGSVPSCCGNKDFHPSCFPIKVPLDDPWLAPLKVRCLEFLRSAPAQRRDCVLTWREQTNQATSYIDASPIYANTIKSSDNARVFRNGLLVFGRGNPAEDVCQRGAIATQCIRAGDGRSGEQPGLLALHHVWVGEHNRIAMELSEMNLHWSDERIYQETRRIVGALFQHITYREFLPIILGREVCKLFDLELLSSGYYLGYDAKVNPAVANSFAAAAFRFGHSLVQSSYVRCDRHHNVIRNNVSLHEEFQRGDIGSAGSLHRLIRGMATQRALKRDEFITPELTNHLFQTPGFPFGLDLAAINIQRGRDHGIPPYTAWRVPCGLTPITTWEDFANVVGPESAQRIGHAYRSVHDIDLFVGGIAERPVVGGLVGPTFACILAQQFSNSRKGDRFWYENDGFESAFTPAQLHSIRRVSLAQVLCRAVGGGTFQPHIFIPAEFSDNERLPCGAGPLAPIDLSPWQEQDPFAAPTAPPTPSFAPDRVFEIISTDSQSNTHFLKENKAGFSNRVRPTTANATATPLAHVPQIDFIPNSSSGFHRPADVVKVHDKLDIRQKGSTAKRPTTARPVKGVNNKLDKGTKLTLNIKNVNLHRLHITRRTTAVVNNIPIEMRSATPGVGETKQSAKNGVSNTKGLKTDDAVAKPSNRHTNTQVDLNTHKVKARTDDDDFRQVEDNMEHTRGETKMVTVESTPRTAANDETLTTVAEENIFNIVSTITKLTTTTETTTELQPTDDDHDNRSHSTGVTSTWPTLTDTTEHQSRLNLTDTTEHQSRLNLTEITETQTRTNLTDITETQTRPDSTDMTEHQTRTNLTDITRTQTRPNLNDTTDDQQNSHNALSSHQSSVGSNVETKKASVKSPPAEQESNHPNKQTENLLETNEKNTDGERSPMTSITTSDIDPLTHSSTRVHKRVQRRKLPDRTNSTVKRTTATTETTAKTQTRTKTLTTKTAKTTKPPHLKRTTTQLANSTKRNAELRQYQTQPTFYTRPQKVVVSGPNADQYEIEINIRQTNKKNPSSTRPHASTYAGDDYTTAYKPYTLDRYSPHYASDYFSSTAPQRPYYQPPPTVSSTIPQLHRTKPPTVIYLSEHDEGTTTRPPGLLHNFISFATSGFSGANRPNSSPHSSVQKERPSYESGVTSIHISSPHSSNPGVPSAQYVPRPQSLPSSQSILPSSAVSLSQVGGLVSMGGVHASSSAISAGNFGSITGVASANGADSTFSFNIRPKPIDASQTALLTPKPVELGGYGLMPPRKPIYGHITKPEYVSLPVATSAGGHPPSYYETPHKESVNSPFSTPQKRPQSHTYEYYSRTPNSPQLKKSSSSDQLTVHDYDEYSNARTLQPIMANDTSAEEEDDDALLIDDYDYDDEHIDVGKKFDRDGYLRPEHMANAIMFKMKNSPSGNGTCKNSNATFLDDNYVLPMLNMTLPAQRDLPEPIAATTDITQLTENATDFPDAVGKHFSNDIVAEDYDDGTTEPLLVSKTAALTAMTDRRQDAEPVKSATGIAYAPIKVLTKLERPDNWVIYDTPSEKPLLPELPQIAFDASASTAEIPTPMQGQLNIRIKKPNNKERRPEAGIMVAVKETDKPTTIDSVTVAETQTEITDVGRTIMALNDLKISTVH